MLTAYYDTIVRWGDSHIALTGWGWCLCIGVGVLIWRSRE